MAPFNQRRPYDPTEDIMRLRSPQVFGQQLYDGGDEGNNVMGQDPSEPQMPQSSPLLGFNGLMQQQPYQSQAPRMTVAERTKQMLDTIGQVYTPSHTASDKYNNWIEQAPVNKGRGLGMSILGGIQAFKDPKAANEMLDDPYNRAKEQWQTKLGPYQQAATLENQQNVNERSLAGNVASYMTSQDKLEETERANKAKEATSAVRAAAYAAKNNRWQVNFGRDRVTAVDLDGKFHDLGPTTEFTKEDEVNLTGAWRSNAAAIQGANATDRTDIAGLWALFNTLQQGQNAVNTKTAESGGSASDPKQVAARLSQALNQELLTHPDYIKKGYIKQNPDGSYMYGNRPEPGFFSTATIAQQKEFDEMRRRTSGAQPIAPTATPTFKIPSFGGATTPRMQQFQQDQQQPQPEPQQAPGMLSPEQSMSPVPPRLNQIADQGQGQGQNMSPAPDVNQNQNQPTGQNQGFTPRSEYTRGNQGNPNPPTPWFKDAYKNAVTPSAVSPASRGIYQKQEMTPGGPKTVMDNAWKQRIIAELSKRGKQITEETIRMVMESGEVK